MKQLTKLFIAMMMVILTSVSVYSQEQFSTDVIRYNQEQHQKEILCDVQYYVDNGYLYVNKEFSYLGVIFTAGSEYIGEKSLIFVKSEKTGWWKTKLTNAKFGTMKLSTISGLVLRNCKYNQPSGTHYCYDGYLYNNTKNIPAWRGTSVLNTATNQIINTLKKI